MEEDTEVLDEVVVVGYGAQKKESVVGAISQVSSKELLKSPAANISQAIAGKISGVITSQTSGAPGSDDMKIYIRGRASFAGDNQPLILVDGVEREFSQIAPDDIESISTLKDASATAVYGVRGANGVMLITTKRGKEQKPTVSLTARILIWILTIRLYCWKKRWLTTDCLLNIRHPTSKCIKEPQQDNSAESMPSSTRM